MLLAFTSGAQNLPRIDSLKYQLKQASGEQKFEILNDLGFEYRLFSPDSTIYFCKQAYELGQALMVKKNLSKPLSFIGLANAYKGEYKTAFEYHQEAI